MSFRQVLEWFLSNIAWVLLTLILGFIFGIYKSIVITYKILWRNRPVQGAGRGKHYADRFIDVWYSKETEPLRYEKGVLYKGLLSFINYGSAHSQNVIDEELVKLKLIEIVDSNRGYKVVKPLKTWTNKLVVFFTIFYLTTFIGDDKSYYKNKKS